MYTWTGGWVHERVSRDGVGGMFGPGVGPSAPAANMESCLRLSFVAEYSCFRLCLCFCHDDVLRDIFVHLPHRRHTMTLSFLSLQTRAFVAQLSARPAALAVLPGSFNMLIVDPAVLLAEASLEVEGDHEREAFVASKGDVQAGLAAIGQLPSDGKEPGSECGLADSDEVSTASSSTDGEDSEAWPWQQEHPSAIRAPALEVPARGRRSWLRPEAAALVARARPGRA